MIFLHNASTLSLMVQGKERGRTKLVRGFWGDVVISPYHALGTHGSIPPSSEVGPEAAERAVHLFDIHSRHSGAEQYRHTAEELSVYNVLSWLWELETGERYALKRDHDVYSGIGEEMPRGEGGGEEGEGEAGEALRAAADPERLEQANRAKAVRRARSIARSLRGVKVFLVGGSVEEWAGRRRFLGLFDVACFGTRSAHHIKDEKFANTLKANAVLVAETGRNAVILSQEQKVSVAGEGRCEPSLHGLLSLIHLVCAECVRPAAGQHGGTTGRAVGWHRTEPRPRPIRGGFSGVCRQGEGAEGSAWHGGAGEPAAAAGSSRARSHLPPRRRPLGLAPRRKSSFRAPGLCVEEGGRRCEEGGISSRAGGVDSDAERWR